MHPVLFELFGYSLHMYWVMGSIGYVLGTWLVVKELERNGMDRRLIFGLVWRVLVGGYLGALLLETIVHWEHYWRPCFDYEGYNQLNPGPPLSGPYCWEPLSLLGGGGVFYGSFLGGLVVVWSFTRQHQLSLLKTADAFGPTLAIVQLFGRLGCFAGGCCWGKPTDLAWGVQFPRTSIVFFDHLKKGLVGARDTHSLPVHPTQLYDSACGLLLFFVLYWVARHKRYDGQVLICWLFLYPLMRTIVELFRGDEYRGFLFKFVNEPLNGLLGLPEGSATFLSTAQFISLALICAAGAGIVYLRRGAHRRTA
jgi:phosphatidylglycerol:prolipoprotein diacylglycerol transferase